MLQVLAACMVGYVAMELLGVFSIREFSVSTKALFTRSGIVVTYLSALVGGSFFYWDGKAQQNSLWATQLKAAAESENALLAQLMAEAHRELQAQHNRNNAIIRAMEAELERTATYVATKPWLGKLAIFGIVAGSYLQLLGAS